MLNQIVDYLNANPAVVLALAGLISVVLQYGINKVKELSRLTNAVLGIVAIPGVITGAIALGTSVHATQFPIVVIISQLLYHVYENLKANALENALKQSLPVASPAEIV